MIKTLVIGIDLGNSNCSMSYFTPGVDAKTGSAQSVMVPLESSGQGISPNILPSVVLFPYDGSEPVVGSPARYGDGGLRFANFKEKLMAEAEPRAIISNGIAKSSLDALTTLLSFLAKKALGHGSLNPHFTERAGQIVPKQPIYLTLGVPAQAPENYKDRLRRACVDSGWLTQEQIPEYLSFVTEPVAAALNYEPGERRKFFIFDDGGLTLDMVRIEVDKTQSPPYRVTDYKERVTITIHERPLNVGGSLLDRLLLRFMLTREGGAAAHKGLIENAYESEFDAAQLEKLVQMEKDPPDAGNEARVYAYLCRDIERLRVSLSSFDVEAGTLSLGSSVLPVKTKLRVKKSELKEVFRDVVKAVMQKMPSSIGADEFCFVVGGCSLTPVLQVLMKEYFTNVRVVMPNAPMETIAQGLSKYYPSGVKIVDGLPQPGPVVADTIDTDYGIWNSEAKRYDVVLPKGTAFSAASLPKSGVPAGDKGVFKVYQPVTPSTEIRLRVGQRVPTAPDEWDDLGERIVHLPSKTTQFRIYFGIMPQQGVLELRLSSTDSKEGIIPVNDSRFQIKKTA